DKAWVAKITDDQDTLFITADTLVSIDSDIPENKRLLAYHNVKIYKKDMQGVADSLAYITADSIIHFYRDPVLWNTGNQMTADSVRSEEHTSELQSRENLVCRLLLEKKKRKTDQQ